MLVKRVYVASPFQGASHEETRQNIIYARLCMLDSLARGESPYLSHLLYTQVWPEDAASREAGLKAGDAWRESADLIAVYTDLGVTSGMQRALDKSGDTRCIGRTLHVPGGPTTATTEEWRRMLYAMELDGFPALEGSSNE